MLYRWVSPLKVIPPKPHSQYYYTTGPIYDDVDEDICVCGNDVRLEDTSDLWSPSTVCGSWVPTPTHVRECVCMGLARGPWQPSISARLLSSKPPPRSPAGMPRASLPTNAPSHPSIKTPCQPLKPLGPKVAYNLKNVALNFLQLIGKILLPGGY